MPADREGGISPAQPPPSGAVPPYRPLAVKAVRPATPSVRPASAEPDPRFDQKNGTRILSRARKDTKALNARLYRAQKKDKNEDLEETLEVLREEEMKLLAAAALLGAAIPPPPTRGSSSSSEATQPAHGDSDDAEEGLEEEAGQEVGQEPGAVLSRKEKKALAARKARRRERDRLAQNEGELSQLQARVATLRSVVDPDSVRAVPRGSLAPAYALAANAWSDDFAANNNKRVRIVDDLGDQTTAWIEDIDY